MYRELGLPQSWTVQKGDYPVYIYIGLTDDFEGRVAYAELVIKDETPTYWELSLIPENLLTDSFEKKMNGMYPVENGLSCFADFETFKLYDNEVSNYNKADTAHIKDTNYLSKQRQKPIGLTDMKMIMRHKIMMFSEGYGCVTGDYKIDDVRYEKNANPDFVKRGFKLAF